MVITGLSGSGKSSLAFDTIYAEGQRRYVESLSAYARQFLGQMDKPDVDYIEGLSPAISIDQKGASHNPRSTVGTVTEIYDYLRLLYARVGRPHCPKCGRPIQQQTVEQIVDAVLELPEGARIMVLAPLVRGRKGEYQQRLRRRPQGRLRARARRRRDPRRRRRDRARQVQEAHHRGRRRPPGRARQRRLDEGSDPDDRRIADSVEQALKLGSGTVIIVGRRRADGAERQLLLRALRLRLLTASRCGEIEPRSFSFNSPHGACPTCTGLGHRDWRSTRTWSSRTGPVAGRGRDRARGARPD